MPTLKKIIFGYQSDVGVNFHQCLSQGADAHLGGEWTLIALGEDFFMAEDGQGEDRLVMFAMSKFNIVLLLYYNYIHSVFTFKTVHRTVRKVFFKSRRNAAFWSKVGKTGIGKQGIFHMGW